MNIKHHKINTSKSERKIDIQWAYKNYKKAQLIIVEEVNLQRADRSLKSFISDVI